MLPSTGMVATERSIVNSVKTMPIFGECAHAALRRPGETVGDRGVRSAVIVHLRMIRRERPTPRLGLCDGLRKASPSLVVDGHSLAYRAFFALPVDNFSTKDGQHTNGIYGFLSMFVNLVKAEKPTHLAVAFDTSRHSFRTDQYPRLGRPVPSRPRNSRARSRSRRTALPQ